MPNYTDFLSQSPLPLLVLLLVWTLFWKGLALWRAAKSSQRNWFIAILIVNSVGILDITYLFFFAKKRLSIENFRFWKNNQ